MMIFEYASPADGARVAEIVNLAYRGENGGAGWTSEVGLLQGPRISEESVKKMLRSGRVLLAKEQDTQKVLGCINVVIDDDGAWHTSMLAVNPEGQTAGIGKALKQEVERLAIRAGATRMRMEVIRQRQALMDWHRRRGYEPTGVVLPFPYDDPSVGRPLRTGLELVVMEKSL